MVRIIHYDHDGYIVTEGIVSRLDTDFRSMTIVKTVISLDDIWDVEVLDCSCLP